MDEPILEALSFDLQSDLTLGSSETGATASDDDEHEALVNCKNVLNRHRNLQYSTQRVLHNSLALTPCIFPTCAFISSQPLVNEKCQKQYDDFVNHLKLEHHFSISEINSIANLHKYALYWKGRFAETLFSELCSEAPEPVIDSSSHSEEMETDLVPAGIAGESVPVTHDESKNMEANEVRKHLTILPSLEEDKQLRNKLWTDRLETILEVNRYEREQTNLAIQCLFCKQISSGNKSNLMDHMLEKHSFHIGKADNIVFFQELMEFLVEIMSKLQCIFCEKTFKDRTVLREHMRKKQHKKINPSNPDYDIYYLVNYLEPGKTWQALDEEGPIERNEEEWLEMKNDNTSIVCLFCPVQEFDFEKLLTHMMELHKFNFEELTKDKDFYDRVKIVNFIRRNLHQNTCLYCETKFSESKELLHHIESQHHELQTEFPPPKAWNRAEYFFPTYENDQFLILLEKDNYTEEDGILLDSTETDDNIIAEDLPNTLPPSFYALNKEMRNLPASCFHIQE